MWEYKDSNESNWFNHTRECYPIAVYIPELIYQGFSRNIKVFLETNYIDSIPIYITIAWHLWCQLRSANANWEWLYLYFSFLHLLSYRFIRYITIKLNSYSYISCLIWYSIDSTVKWHSITAHPFACLIPANHSE